MVYVPLRYMGRDTLLRRRGLQQRPRHRPVARSAPQPVKPDQRPSLRPLLRLDLGRVGWQFDVEYIVRRVQAEVPIGHLGQELRLTRERPVRDGDPVGQCLIIGLGPELKLDAGGLNEKEMMARLPVNGRVAYLYPGDDPIQECLAGLVS